MLDTKEKIVDITFKLLLNKGYDGVSITDIQQASGLSRGLLYHYFSNKKDLFLEVAKVHFINLFVIDLDDVVGFHIDDMIRYLVAKYRYIIDSKLNGENIINYDFLFYRLMQEHSELITNYENAIETELTAWRCAIENSIIKGTIRDDFDSSSIAKQFVYITDGVWLRAALPRVNIDFVGYLDDALTTAHNLLKK